MIGMILCWQKPFKLWQMKIGRCGEKRCVGCSRFWCFFSGIFPKTWANKRWLKYGWSFEITKWWMWNQNFYRFLLVSKMLVFFFSMCTSRTEKMTPIWLTFLANGLKAPTILLGHLLDKLQRLAAGASKLCVEKGKKMATKAMLVSSWQTIFKQRDTGHSARRTGALSYIREGWSISQVAYLGRWKSSVILQYAEEALASMPANRTQESSAQEGNGGVALVYAMWGSIILIHSLI